MNLRARLSHTRGLAAAGSRRTAQRVVQMPSGWARIDTGLWYREHTQRAVCGDDTECYSLSAFSARLAGCSASLGGTLFFDFETTGLSGAAGTTAFLAALASFRGGTIALRQFFIEDYPHEAAMLAALAENFSKAEAIVTYNGASFDMPLYGVRLSMNGIRPRPLPPHVDMLYPARRLWKSKLPDCSLATVERAVLHILRHDDIPGRDVPCIWFDFLRRGYSERLPSVLNHNACDTASLANLYTTVYLCVTGKRSHPLCDALGLASLQSAYNEALAERTLTAALTAGENRAVRPLMQLYKRQGRLAERQGLIPFLPDDAQGLFSKSVYAERVLRDTGEALRLCGLAAEHACAGSQLARRAERRMKRLQHYS